MLALAATTLVGCTAKSSADAKPTITEVTLTPNPDSVLSASLTFTTTPAATATLHIDGPASKLAPMAERAAATKHDIPVVGLRAETSYEVWVDVRGKSGDSVASQKVPFRTGTLPVDLPPITVTSEPAHMAPGVTLFDATRRKPPPPVAGQPAPMLGNLIAVDADGNIVWYHRAESPIGDARMLANGHLLYEYNNMGAQEIDLLGRVVREWAGRLELGRLSHDRYGRTVAGPHAIPLDFDSIHHEIRPLPSGNFLTLSNELRTVHGFTKPMCGEDPSKFTGSYRLISDIVVEFEPATGKVVRRWPLSDYLHPQTNPADANICGYPGAALYPNFLYNALGDVYDWTHANAAVYDAKRNAILVSIRHLDTVLAIRYRDDDEGKSGSLKWRFGPQGSDFKLASGGTWQYHQHAVEVQPDDSLLLYDNGNDRPGTDAESPDPARHPYSRAVRYEVDDTGPRNTWTVTQEWEHRSTIDGAPLYAFFVSDADRQPNGNVLIDDGGITDPATANAQIVEVRPRRRSGGDTVFTLKITGAGVAWFAYRAERLPSLYGPLAA